MIISISAKARAVTAYEWYTYEGKKKREFTGAHPTYDLELTTGEKFGIRFGKKYFYIMPEDMLTIEFKVNIKDAQLLVKASRGFRGKMGGVKVAAGTKGKDKKKLTHKPDETPVESKPTRVEPIENPEIMDQIKQVKFPGIRHIKYLTTQRTLLGEVYHYYDITSTLNAYRRAKKLPITSTGNWAAEIEVDIEKAFPNLDVEIGGLEYEGQFIRVMTVVEIE